MNRNRIPEDVKRVHMIAVCGTGMGALACMLKDKGYMVTGSDSAVYPPMSTFLQSRGIPIFDGFHERNLDSGPDLVIVGNAVRRDNPEALRTAELGLNFCSMPQAVNRFIADGKKTVLVAGTHGKTTTSALAAGLLTEAGYDPSFFIGGILTDYASNYRLGSGDYIVIEGDEYDTAYFDKEPKFLHYFPHVGILTGVEFDHADIFKDIEHVKKAFEKFVSKLNRGDTLVAYDDNAIVDELVGRSSCRVMRYGVKPGSEWSVKNIHVHPPWTEFDVVGFGKPYGRFRSRLMGMHNVVNALAVIAASGILEVPAEKTIRALSAFSGVKRRQEIRGMKNGITVMDDFAHHPTAVRETIAAVRPFYPDGRIIAVYEPRTNTSMRNVFQRVYPDAFSKADIICIRKPPLLSKIPPEERFSSKKLVSDLQKKGKNAHYFQETEPIIEFLKTVSKPKDLILIMSNGGFDNIHERVLEALCPVRRPNEPSKRP
ncbi:MAG: UDP-N-acetylmuramate--L-alanine ligase [Desulfobacterales bacterium]